MSSPLRIALTGNGFSRSVILPCLRHVPGIEVVGIASRTQDRLLSTAEEFSIPVTASCLPTLLDACSPDLVLIATPPHLHCEQAIAALEAGCHVLCEKPMALSLSEANQMLAVSKQRPKQLALIDHELRFDCRRSQLRAWVREGRFGQLQHVDYSLSSPAFRGEREWTWWSDLSCGGGLLGAIGSHVVDGLRDLFGEVLAVRGDLQTLIKQRRDPISQQMKTVTSDDYCAFWLEFESGLTANVSLNIVAPQRRHVMSLSAEKGCAQLIEQKPLRVVWGTGALEDVECADGLASNVELGIPDTDWARSFLIYMREIVHAIQSQQQLAIAADFEQGCMTQSILDQIRDSASVS